MSFGRPVLCAQIEPTVLHKGRLNRRALSIAILVLLDGSVPQRLREASVRSEKSLKFENSEGSEELSSASM